MLGDGSINNPFQLSSAEHLEALRENLKAYFLLTSDIQMEGVWGPVAGFAGCLDGGGHRISGLTVDYQASHYGMFSNTADGATFRNLHLVSSAAGVKGSSSYYGGLLVGAAFGSLDLSNITAEGMVDSGGDRAGGLIGYRASSARPHRVQQVVVKVVIVQPYSRVGAVLGYDEAGTTAIDLYFSGSYAGGGQGTVNGGMNGAWDIGTPANFASPEAYVTTGQPAMDFASAWQIANGVAVPKRASQMAAGQGFFAGAFPGGVTTIEGTPGPADIRVLLRAPGTDLDGVLIAATTSAADGTWRVEGLDPARSYDVVCRSPGYNDMILSNVIPKPY